MSALLPWVLLKWSRHNNRIHHDLRIGIALLLPFQPTPRPRHCTVLKHNGLRKGMSASHWTTLRPLALYAPKVLYPQVSIRTYKNVRRLCGTRTFFQDVPIYSSDLTATFCSHSRMNQYWYTHTHIAYIYGLLWYDQCHSIWSVLSSCTWAALVSATILIRLTQQTHSELQCQCCGIIPSISFSFVLESYLISHDFCCSHVINAAYIYEWI